MKILYFADLKPAANLLLPVGLALAIASGAQMLGCAQAETRVAEAQTPAPQKPTQQAPMTQRAVTPQTPEDDYRRAAEAAIAPEKLSRDGWTDEQYAFKQEVYRLHVARGTRAGRARIFDLPPQQLALIPGTQISMRRDAAAQLGALLAAARSDLARDLAAQGDDAATAQWRARAQRVDELAINNAYRSASRQFGIWNRNYKQYYEATREQRRAANGGEHGAAAADLLRSYIGVRVAAPGYSNHQGGIAVDFALKLRPDSGQKAGGQTLGASMAQSDPWKESWFWHWLKKRAAEFGFVEYEAEPWHWEYKPEQAQKETAAKRVG